MFDYKIQLEEVGNIEGTIFNKYEPINDII